MLSEYLLSSNCARHNVSMTEKFPIFKEFIACRGERKFYEQLEYRMAIVTRAQVWGAVEAHSSGNSV